MNAGSAQLAYNALQSAGLSDPALSLAWAQSGFETAGFTSNVFNAYNNASGIEDVVDSVTGAYDSGQAKSDGGDFAAYPDLNTWALDMKRILSLQLANNNIGAPVDATTPQDYVNRLEANNYFGSSSATTYLNAIIANLNVKNSVINTASVNNGGSWSAGDTSTGSSFLAAVSPALLLAKQASPKTMYIAAGAIIFIVSLLLILSQIKTKKNG